MYNAEQKSKFIKEFTDSVKTREAAQNLFKTIMKYEEEYGADVVTMDLCALQRVFNLISGMRVGSQVMPRYVLREYSKWALEHGVSGATDAAMHLDSPGIEKFRTETLKNPKQLQVFLNTICVPESEQTSDNNLRAWYWLAYSGVQADESVLIKSSELDFDSLILTHNGIPYPIYRESVPAFRNCATLSQYRYFHPNYGEVVIRDRVNSDLLLRGIRGEPTLGVFRSELSKRNRAAIADGKTTLKMSYHRIWLSGVFYRMHEDELAGIPADFYAVTNMKLGDKQFKLSSGRNTQQYKREVISRDYLIDYERWKQTLT